jgi:putative transposase
MPRRSSRRELSATVASLRSELHCCRRAIRNLQCENEILREAAAPLIHQAEARERFAFIHARRGRFAVKLMCRILVTDGANYHAWCRNQDKRRAREDDECQLTGLILEVHTAHPAYGVLRVTRESQRLGVPVGRRVAARLMRENGVSGRTRRRRRNLTRPTAGAAAVPDLICREFTAPMPGLKLVGGITCFKTSKDGCTYGLGLVQ